MFNRPTSHLSAGTGPLARPGADDSAPVGTEDWEDWYNTNYSRVEDSRQRNILFPGAAGAGRLGWRRVMATVTGAAAVLAVFSAGVLYADLRSGPETAAATAPYLPPATAARPPVPAATVTVAAPAPTGIVQAPSNVPVVTQPAGARRGSPPIRIRIPALKIDQRLVGLRVTANRQLEVPHNWNDIGWWSTGPVAGDPGAAVIVGHVDSTVGPAVFYRLSSLTRGDTIAVGRADGSTVTFKVTRLQSFSKQHFPDKLVYRTSGKPSLHLLTCGGPYDRSRGGYLDNVVVFADQLQPRPRATPKRPTITKPTVKRRSPTQRHPTARPHRTVTSAHQPARHHKGPGAK